MHAQAWWVAGLCGLCAANVGDRLIDLERGAAPAGFQARALMPPDPSEGVVYVCPLDPDVRAHEAGTCHRCGRTLAAAVPDPVEYHLDLRVIPSPPQPDRPAVLQFVVRDPWRDRPVKSFNVVHERLLHTFIVSEDLEFFEHGHPRLVADGVFQHAIAFPQAGMFRVAGDYYPTGATPQFTSDTVFLPGPTAPPPSRLDRDYSLKTAENVRVSLATIPEQPVATARTQLRFRAEAPGGLQRFFGEWSHMFAASSDLIDMMHEHPLLADGSPQLEFEMVFPRPGAYRLWVQFQSDGIVNTVHFDVPVAAAAP